MKLAAEHFYVISRFGTRPNQPAQISTQPDPTREELNPTQPNPRKSRLFPTRPNPTRPNPTQPAGEPNPRTTLV